MNIDKDALVEIIAALGARADRVKELEGNRDTWMRWYNEENDKVGKLRKQLEDIGIVPLV